jgi:hypothetical protein
MNRPDRYLQRRKRTMSHDAPNALRRLDNPDQRSAPTHTELDAAFATLQSQWPDIAVLAWTGYVDDGRGAVVLSEPADAGAAQYVAGPVWMEAAGNAMIETYNPRREVVVVIMRDTGETFHRIEARPSPPDAAVCRPIARPRRPEPHERAGVPASSTVACDRGADVSIDPTLLNDPLAAGDALVGQPCPFCGALFEVGELTKWVSTGPVDRREYGRARRGEIYMSRSPWAFHCDCGDPTGLGQ